MEEKPKIILNRTHRLGSVSKKFAFNEHDVRDDTMKDFRTHAWKVFNNLTIPTINDEAWRRTDLRALPADTFRIPLDGAFRNISPIPIELLNSITTNKHRAQIILLSGESQSNPYPPLVEQGVVFSDLRTAVSENPSLVAQIMGKVVRPEEGIFSALAAALSQNGIFLYVPKGVTVQQPLHSVLWSSGMGVANIFHVVIWLDEGASATYVHEASSSEDAGDSMQAGIIEIRLDNRASLRFIELQSLGNHVWNFTHERIHVGRNGNLDWIIGALGSQLTKSFLDLELIGEGSTGRISGFFFTDGRQHLDYDTRQKHLAPHTTSDLLFKGVLKGNSRSVWRGMIYVAPGAQKADGYQANRNIILSPQARADSIPGLEILADDVRCTHGATVSKLEQEPLFYLKSRGIPQTESEQLMVEGFYDPILQRIPFEMMRERIRRIIAKRTKR